MTAAGNVAQPALIKGFLQSQPMTCNKSKAPHIFQLAHQEMTELFPRLFYDTRIKPNKVDHRRIFLT